ncbi:MAG: CapA family protein [Solirubrobacterales bacterium]
MSRGRPARAGRDDRRPDVRPGGDDEPAVAQARAASPTAITLAWVGDTMLGHDAAQPPSGGRELFAPMRRWLRSADLALGNLEGVLSSAGTSKCAGPCQEQELLSAFRVLRRRRVAALRWAGFDALEPRQQPRDGLRRSWPRADGGALRDHGIASTGRPGEITLLRVHATRIALVGLAPYPWAQSSLDLAGAAALVRSARSRADVVIALIHAGAEGSGQTHTPAGRETAFGDRGDTRALAHTLVDAGAALVLGSGPHVVRGIERRRGALIAYSLGELRRLAQLRQRTGARPDRRAPGSHHAERSGAGRALGLRADLAAGHPAPAAREHQRAARAQRLAGRFRRGGVADDRARNARLLAVRRAVRPVHGRTLYYVLWYVLICDAYGSGSAR